jgi:hypothetical protein
LQKIKLEKLSRSPKSKPKIHIKYDKKNHEDLISVFNLIRKLIDSKKSLIINKNFPEFFKLLAENEILLQSAGDLVSNFAYHDFQFNILLQYLKKDKIIKIDFKPKGNGWKTRFQKS